MAATASAVKAAYDLANGKQDKLVSGTNIKTVNGTSILGSGDITISGGSDANVQAVDTGDVLDDVNVEYATKTYVDNKVANISLTGYATIAYVDGLVGDINSVLESIISGGGNTANIISFTIEGVEYQAEEGMTWEDWVNSEYNTGQFVIQGSYIGLNDEFVFDAYGALLIPNTSIIESNGEYSLSD